MNPDDNQMQRLNSQGEQHQQQQPQQQERIPIRLQQEQGLSNLFLEENRLATFKNWPNPNISPISLAKAGFFYLNRSDEVKCAWCNGVIAKWEESDDAFQEHRRFFPNCPRVKLGPLLQTTNIEIRELGIQQVTTPLQTKYVSLDARLRTYTNWPISDIQRPDALALAGLYYQNVDDQVRCFHCNIGLRSWQQEDDPWFEHAKWSPECQFVRLAKGLNYIQNVQEATSQAVEQIIDIPPISINEAMKSVPVIQALEIGIDRETISNVLQQKITSTGTPYNNIEDLLKAVFDDRVSDDTITTPSSSSSQSQSQSTQQNDNEAGVSTSLARGVTRIFDSLLHSARDFGNNDAAVTTTDNHNSQTIRTPTDAINTDEKPSVSSSCTKDIPDVKPIKLASSPPRSISLEEENRKLKDARLCKVCLDEEVGVVFLPCGHLVTCVQCAPSVQQCPMCRSRIKGFVRTYLS